jgi:hypothetical protein
MKRRILIVARSHAEYRDFCRKNNYDESEHRYFANPTVIRGVYKPYQEVWFIGHWWLNKVLLERPEISSNYILEKARTNIRKDIKNW